MTTPHATRWRSLLHTLWSMGAVCLFALSGLLGYLALMESVAVATSPEQAASARVLHARVVAPGREIPPVARGWWGYHVELDLLATDLQQNYRVSVAPLMAFPWGARVMRDRLLRSGEVQIYPDPEAPGTMRLRHANLEGGVLLPSFCAFCGLLCLAASLRYQPSLLVAKSTASPDGSTKASPSSPLASLPPSPN